MTYLSSAQVLFIHMRLIAETGGSAGIRDFGLLAAAVARPQATFDSRDLYPELFAKAAALMDSLVRNHPFVDGNKRVGITSAGLFLRLNGWHLTANQSELEHFTLQVAQSQLNIEKMARWFEHNSRNQIMKDETR
ncbi:MAG: type II toxin-antitoxin system death-on-curing family toxin [Chloroflexi bacterium]|nr:type II toxin-antitoxin system death-on-curing family toxin [Chloroflexota bacterium]